MAACMDSLNVQYSADLWHYDHTSCVHVVCKAVMRCVGAMYHHFVPRMGETKCHGVYPITGESCCNWKTWRNQ